MYRAIIADDEVIVRNGLIRYFDWAKYDIEVVGEADNGRDALALAKQYKVHIVITDVRMPFMDGIELVEHLKKLDGNIKVVFISGYDDIDYLKKALKLDAIDYILKSIDLDEFEQTIHRIITKIKSEDRQKKMLSEMEIRLAQSFPLLQEKLLMSLIHDDTDNIPSLKDRIDFLELNLKNTSYYCILVAQIQDRYSVYAKTSEHDKQLLSFAIQNISEELLGKYCDGIMFESSLGEFTFILPLDSDNYETILLDFSDELAKVLQESLDISVIFGASELLQGITHIKESYKKAIGAINYGFSLGKNQTLKVDQNGKSCNIPRQPWEAMLTASLSNGDKLSTAQNLEHIFSQITSTLTEDQIWNELFYLILLPEHVLSSFRIKGELTYGNTRKLCERFYCCNGFNERSELIRQIYMETAEIIGSRRENQTDHVIAYLTQIMNECFTQPITIADLAEKVYLTPTYICLLFKQETGITINEYIINLRIEYAKKLLEQPQMKLYDVCSAVGYTSPSYFSRLFKKQTGFSPSEYRDAVLS